GNAASTFSVDAAGNMPVIHAHVSAGSSELDPAIVAATRFQWSVHISAPVGFAPHQIADFTVSPDLQETVQGADDYTPTFTTVAGGKLTLTVTATIDGVQLSATTSGLTI